MATTKRSAWEYTIEVLDLGPGGTATSMGQLNHRGKQGWELVSVVSKMGDDESRCLAILKRQISK